MGLLSQKNRIMDTILTDEGRRQLGTGQFKPAYYSFSDAGAVYSPLDTAVSGTSPETNIATIITFEACPLPQDQVSYEADDSGALRVFSNNNYFETPEGFVRVIAGQLVKGWEKGTPEILSASGQFASSATAVLSGTTDNFRRLMLLKSPDLLYTNRDEFKVSSNNIGFVVNDTSTLLPGNITSNTLESSDNLFSDRRLSHLDNFLFLPPINNRQRSSDQQIQIGDYSTTVNGNREIRTLNELRREIQNVVVQAGSVQQQSILQRETIVFTETTITNRIVGQMFEVSNNKISKLDVVDFGVYLVPAGAPPLFPEAVPESLNRDSVTATSRAHVYFVGKVFTDATGNDKFINIFNLIWQ